MELFHHVASHFPPDRIKTIKKRRPEFQFFLNEINCRPIRNSAKAGSWFRALRLLQTWNNISVFHLFFMSDPVSKDYQSNGFRCGSKLSPPTETFRFGAEHIARLQCFMWWKFFTSSRTQRLQYSLKKIFSHPLDTINDPQGDSVPSGSAKCRKIRGRNPSPGWQARIGVVSASVRHHLSWHNIHLRTIRPSAHPSASQTIAGPRWQSSLPEDVEWVPSTPTRWTQCPWLHLWQRLTFNIQLLRNSSS